MTPPTVSVILPTQGARPSLVSAINSVLAQSHEDWELIVVDDAADQDSGWHLQSEFDAIWQDPRVRRLPFRQARGCAAAKNAGLAAATGEWVCYLDDDNVYRPTKVSAQFEIAQTRSSPIVLCGIEFRIRGRRRIRQSSSSTLEAEDLALEALPDTNVIFHRRENSPLWDEELRTADDACYFHAIRIQNKLTIVPNAPAPLVVYNSHEGPRENTNPLSLYRGQRRMFVQWTSDFPQPVRRRLLLRLLLSMEKYRSGRWMRFWELAAGLWRASSGRDARFLLNVLGHKIPGLRSWMVR